MNAGSKEFLKRFARHLFFRHFFATFWSLIGIACLIAGLCILPKTIRMIQKVRRETRQALVEGRSALRETRKAIRDAYRAAEYLHQPFEIKIQLHGESDWLDMTTTGQAVIAPQEKTAPQQQ